MRDYKKILEGVVDIINTTEKSDIGFANICTYIGENCPELAESEDEKVRKEILNYIIKGSESRYDVQQYGKEKFEKWIAWLEKQGEQIDIANKEYWRGYREGKQEVLDKYTELEKQGKQKPNTDSLLTWSEDDERMFKCIEGIVKDYWAKAEQEKNKIKIKEASNVSYFLKTIQKSPLCWIKCSDGLPNRDGTYLVVTDGRHNDVYDIARYDSIEGWHKASEIICWMPIPQLNNKSIIEQKPAWSEEDETTKNNISHIIRQYDKISKKENQPCYYVGDCLLWMQNIKDRVQPQIKQEWSEEDAKTLNRISAILVDASEVKNWWKKYRLIEREEMVRLTDFLKSLRPQPTWKPSEGQMVALKCAITTADEKWVCMNTKDLESLYEDLKKLKD